MFNKRINSSRLITKIICNTLLWIILLATGTVYVLSQSNGVEISPSHTQKVTAGQVIVYEHILANNTPSTATFILEVDSTQGWPVELVGGIYPTGTVLLPLQVEAQMTEPFQIRLAVPLNASGVTDITVITATSQTSPTIQNTVIDTTIVLDQIYLPVMLKRWPPIPYQPTLAVIQETDDGNYSVSWSESPSRLANTYILQEAGNYDFTIGLREVCTTEQQSCDVSSKASGIYYYRVRGHNNWGYGEWSNVQPATVPPPPMTLYLHPFPHHLEATPYQGSLDAFGVGTSGWVEWQMTLNKDLVGTDYAYTIDAVATDDSTPLTCDVEILLRRNGQNTVLASWPRAFTAPNSLFDSHRYTGNASGPDPDVQTGDKLVFRIRVIEGSGALLVFIVDGPLWKKSYVQVPGYLP